MGILQTQAMTVPTTAGTTNNACTAAPAGTTAVLISSPVACRVQVGEPGTLNFCSMCYGILDGQPSNGETFTVARPWGTNTTFTFVTSGGGTGTNITIGASLAATVANLVARIDAQGWSGVDAVDLNSAVAGMFQIKRVSGPHGPASDAWSISQGAGGPLLVPASNSFRYFTDGGGTYIPANVPVELPASEGHIVDIWSLGSGSDVSTGAGLSVTWIG